jgi:glycosyltransferase involved in cell wall biosynthesis
MLAEAIVSMAGNAQLCSEMGERGRKWVLENVTREALAERYLDLMEELTGGLTDEAQQVGAAS